MALLWTLHPLQTEAVTYVVQRAESLMGLLYLLTLYCFIRGTESDANRADSGAAQTPGTKARGGADQGFLRVAVPGWCKIRWRLMVCPFLPRLPAQDSLKLTWAAIDAGIVSQNISIFCASLGLATKYPALRWIKKY